ncbi:MAG TPA: VWA domain-containing protein [Bryobacteraceae bacterium]|nr:VWA domain-containing protein [Bryobacteraceae bacterium]
MRTWKLFVLTFAALVVLATLLIGQTQGPIKDPGGATVAKPKKADDGKKDGDGDLPKIPSAYKREPAPDGTQPSFKADVDMVTLDVAVLNNKGQFIPGIAKEQFRILEDNVPQKITAVNMGEAPLTISMVIEFSNKFQQYWGPAWYQTLQLAYGFASTLKPTDYVAVVAYDIKPDILTDFTTDRGKTQEALSRLRIAAWSEANLFDAITDTADRMSNIEGRKAILLISSGIDTFSKITFDQTRKKLQEAGVPIYSIGLMQTLRMLMEARGMMGSIANMDFLQADNELRTFAKETGGQAFFPRFQGEYPGIFQDIHQALRNQYVLTYSPTNKAHDGTYRKLKVELVNPATNDPLRVTDEKGKPVKYSIVTKAGYKAPREVE